jgi:hypothetical protein
MMAPFSTFDVIPKMARRSGKTGAKTDRTYFIHTAQQHRRVADFAERG